VLVAIILIAVGIAACFNEDDLNNILVLALFNFFLFANVLSYLDIFSILEADNETTGRGIVLAFFGIVICGFASIILVVFLS
jgi:multisubunit Na+/H+ antiporter MnhG subunit